MFRILIFIVTGFWWTPTPRCTHKTCTAFRCACASGYCNNHCEKNCYCGLGVSMKSTWLMLKKEDQKILELPPASGSETSLTKTKKK